MNKSKIRHLISTNRLDEAIKELLTATEKTHWHNAVLLQSTRLSAYKSQQIKGTESSDDLNRLRNQIANALLSIVDDFSVEDTPSVSPIKNTFSWTKWTGLNDVKSWIAVLAGLAGIMTFYFKYCKNVPDNDGKPFSVVVYTHGNGGRQDILQLKETKLVADFVKRRDVAKVGENGQNTFNEIPAAFHNKRIGIGLQGTEGYVLRFADSTYLLNGEPIYLAVVQDTKTRLIKAVIKTQNGDVLAGVTITTIGESAVTDAKGYFELTIPADKQQPNYPLTLTKKGYQTATETYIPQSQIAEFRLKK